MIVDNKIGAKVRLKELLFDWLAIVAYLLCLFGAVMLFYTLALGEIPALSEREAQLTATFSSVVPVVVAFSFLDCRGGSPGKRRAGLRLHFEKKTFLSCLIRNIIKFTPWQIAHFGMIRGMYHDFDAISVFAQCLSVALLLIMLAMGLIRKDKRHLGDLLAGTQVQMAD